MADSPTPLTPPGSSPEARQPLPLLGACGCGPGCSCGCQSGAPCKCGSSCG